MGLLPDTRNCGCACAGDAGNVFPITAGERSRHASRHVRHARAVMHAGIANYRFPLKSAAGENVPGIPGACATCNFTYLVRGPWHKATENYIQLLCFGFLQGCHFFPMILFIYFTDNRTAWSHTNHRVHFTKIENLLYHINGLMQDCGISSASAIETLVSSMH